MIAGGRADLIPRLSRLVDVRWCELVASYGCRNGRRRCGYSVDAQNDEQTAEGVRGMLSRSDKEVSGMWPIFLPFPQT